MINNLVKLNKKRNNQEIKEFLYPKKTKKQRSKIKTKVLRFASCEVILPIYR